MANRYWVGGTGNWNTLNTTNWSATSGGSGGASVPTSVDDVFFDANSGTGTVTISANNGAKSVNCTGFTGTWAGTSALNVGGSFTYGAGMTITWTGQLSIIGTGTLTSNGKSRGGTTTINAPGETVTLGDAFATSSTFTVNAGTFDTAGYSVTARIFSSVGTSTRTVELRSSTISVGPLAAQFNLAATGLTFNATSSTVNLVPGSTVTFNGGNQTFGTVVIGAATNTSTVTIQGSNTFGTLTSTRTVAYPITFTAGSTQTFTNFNVSGSAGALVTIGSSSTTQVTLQKPSAWNVGANSVDGGNNTGLSFTGTNPNYLSISRITGVVIGGNATATVTGAEATASAGTVTATATGGNVDATATVTGTQVASQAASVQGLGGATGQVLGSEATSAPGTSSASGQANTATGGAQAAASAGTVVAIGTGSAVASVTGADATTSAGVVAVSGTGLVTVTGTEATASVGTVIALGTGAAVAGVAGAQASTTAGTAAASGQANITATGTQVTITTGVVGITLTATVSLAGAEARAAAGQVTANDGSAKPGIRVVDYAPRFVTKRDAKARVLPVEALATAGRVEAFGQRNVVARVACAHSRLVRGRVRGRGVQNPSDEDIALLLAL